MTFKNTKLVVASICTCLIAVPSFAETKDDKDSQTKASMAMENKKDMSMQDKSGMGMKKSGMGMQDKAGMGMKKSGMGMQDKAGMGMKKSGMGMQDKAGMGMKKSGMGMQDKASMGMKKSGMGMQDKTGMGMKPASALDTLTHNIKEKGMHPDIAFKLALQNPTRPATERAKDIDRMPEDVLEFAGVKPGSRVLNLLSYYGYYAEVLAYRVGETGEVIAQNTPKYSSTGKNISRRLMEHPFPNMKPYEATMKDIKLDKPVDTIMFMSSYHDFYGYLAKDKNERISILKGLKKSLKRGGNLIISDMVAPDGEHNPKMHRIRKDIVLGELQEAGFKLVASSDMLRKPELDDHTTIGYDKTRFYTDRWLMKFTQ